MKLETLIQKTPKDNDSDNVFYYLGKERVGSGFKPKGKSKIALVECPKCEMENYYMQVLEGICFNCTFDANKETK